MSEFVRASEGDRLLREADVALDAGDRATADFLFREMVAHYASAGALDRGLDQLVQRGRWRLAAELAEQLDHWVRAAELWQEQGSLARAARALENADEVLAAAELFEQAGEPGRAASLYESQGALLTAAELFERATQPRAAADLLVRALSSESARLRPYHDALCRRAGALYLKAQDVDQAVRVFQLGAHHALAAQTLCQVGRSAEADRLYPDRSVVAPTQEELEARARAADLEGRPAAAAEAWAEAGRLARAGRSWEAAEEPVKAAASYEVAGELELAIELYQGAGALEDASRCAREQGELSAAQNWQQQRGFTADQLPRVAEEEGPLAAGQLALLLARRGQDELYPRALQLLERAAEDPRCHVAARVLTAEIQAELGNRQAARAQLVELFKGEPEEAQLLPAIYRRARLAEATGDPKSALADYQKVLAYDRRYRDARRRWARLSRSWAQPRRASSTGALLDREIEALQSGEFSAAGSSSDRPAVSPSLLWSVDIPSASAGWFQPSSTPESPSEPSSPASESAAADATSPSSDLPLPILEPELEAEPAADSSAEEPEAAEEPTEAPKEAEVVPQRSSEELLGQRLRGDRFRVERMIGRGSQAVVYLARDTVLDREIAIKVLRERAADSKGAAERFLREAQLAARVHHASCLSVFDFGQGAPHTFIAMEYFSGRTLRQLLGRGTLPLPFSLRVLEAIASGLGAIHQAGIVHRDVKPSNVLVNRSGQVRIADFGVATLVADAKASGVMVGTMKYIAPEQAQGMAVDRRADIFSFGALAFEMLAGAPAFGGDLEALVARASKPPPALPESLGLPDALHRLVARCMAKRPRQRFSSMEPVVEQLQAVSRRLEQDEARTPPEVEPEEHVKA